MINVSEAYLEAIRAPSRLIKYKATIGTSELTGEDIGNMEVEYAAGNDGCVGIGSTISSKLSIVLIRTENVPESIVLQKIKPSVAIDVGGEYEWVPLGEFIPVPSTLKKADLTISFDCYDKMNSYDGYPYSSELTYPSTVGNVVQEIMRHTGESIIIDSSLKTISVPSNPADTIRGALSAIGVLTGTFCIINREGKIEFRKYVDSGFSIDAENYSTLTLESEDSCEITGLTSSVQVDGQSVEILSGNSNGIVLAVSGLYIQAQEDLDEIYGRSFPISYVPHETSMQGMPHVEAGDIISLTDKHEVTRSLHVVTHRLVCNAGGLKSEMSAKMPNTTSTTVGDSGGSGTNLAGSITEQLKELNYRIYAVSKNVDNLEIGARNLIKNSLNLIYDKYYFRKKPTGIKLETPIIYLDTGDNISMAVLGKAILSRMILGKSMTKLGTPSIQLIDGNIKLGTPEIFLSDTGGALKLEAPEIFLSDTGGALKLGTPAIYVVNNQLTAPKIYIQEE